MNNLLKIAGILGGSALVATAVATPPESSPAPIQNEVVQEAQKVVPTKQIEKPALIGTTSDTSNQESLEAEKAVKPTPKPVTRPVSNCHPSYSGCLEMNAGDYDCASGSGNGPNYTGAVEVYGSDPFDLDRDNNGWGCE